MGELADQGMDAWRRAAAEIDMSIVRKRGEIDGMEAARQVMRSQVFGLIAQIAELEERYKTPEDDFVEEARKPFVHVTDPSMVFDQTIVFGREADAEVHVDNREPIPGHSDAVEDLEDKAEQALGTGVNLNPTDEKFVARLIGSRREHGSVEIAVEEA